MPRGRRGTWKPLGGGTPMGLGGTPTTRGCTCPWRNARALYANGRAQVVWQRRADLMPGWDNGKLSVACFACLQSLPGLMGVTPDTIPSPASFLFPKPDGQRWPPRRIACAWEGNPNMPNDVHRSIYK